MYLSMNWIRDFVNLDGFDLVDLIHRFSLSTAEVENEIFFKGKDLKGVVVAEIKEIQNHPESNKLHLLKVDAGDGYLTDVVCGAPNVRLGMKTAFAKVGAQLGEIEITPRKLTGYTSYGMCCSEKEIGISDDNSGIMDITEEVENGTDIKDLYEIDDIIFEVDNKSLTNRPDLWGHYGIAREFASLAERELKPIPVEDLEAYNSLPSIDMKIVDPLCQRYSCIKVENINKNVSPVNMRIRLYYCGMRGINLLADLTNYIMLELGQPMHAFDARKVQKIRIKRFDKPFVFKTLDGVDRNCDENTLMICNDDIPVAIAGVMGGYDSEIVEDTNTLCLESATFDPVSIRKTTVRLSHRTDSSMRYEKSLDPEITTVAIGRFLNLLKQTEPDFKVVSSLTDEYRYKYPEVNLEFDKNFVDRYTGIEISDDTIIKTLTNLGFKVFYENGNFKVGVPSWRRTKDVTIRADIIEEITRIYGYDNFEIHTASTPLYPIRVAEEKTTEEKFKDILVKRYSFHEAHSYIWANYDGYKEIGLSVKNNIKIVNSANPNIETIRDSIVPTQLCQIKTNTLYAPEFGLFEIGRTVKGLKENGLADERKELCITLYSKLTPLDKLYYRFRDIISVAVDDIKHKKLEYVKAQATEEYQHPKNLNKIICDGIEIGEIGLIHPLVASKIDKKAFIVYAVIDIEKLASVKSDSILYKEVSRFPEMTIDLSFIADKFAPIQRAIDAVNCSWIRKVSVIDIYNDNGTKSITVRLNFSNSERTLTGEEVKSVIDNITSLLKNNGILMKQ